MSDVDASLPRITIVAAVAENGVIGRGGDLPWRLPDDLRHFKELTLGHTLLMGRRTWQSIGRPLPGRRTLVLSRDRSLKIAGAAVVHGFDEAVEAAREGGESELFVVGGADVYRIALPRAHRLVLTRVHAEVEGDTRFPPFDPDGWKLVGQQRHEADEDHAHAFTIREFRRPPGPPSSADRPARRNA